MPLTPGDLLGIGLGETVGEFGCDPARTVTQPLGKLAKGVSDLLCNAKSLDFSFYTQLKRADGGVVRRETRTSLGAPTPVEVGDGDITPDLVASIIPLSLERFRLRIDRAPLELLPLPVSIEAIANDPTGGTLPRKRIAFGYDARASRAPQSFETEIRVGKSATEAGATTLAIGYETRLPGPTMDVVGGLFNGTPDARTHPVGVRLGYTPVPQEAGVEMVTGKGTALRKTTVSPTTLSVDAEAVDGTSEQRAKAVVDKLPEWTEVVYTPLGPDRRKVTYKAAASVGRFTLDYQKTAGQDKQGALVTALGIPTGMTLQQTAAKSGSFEATGGVVKQVEAGFANGTPKLLSGVDHPYGYVFDDGTLQSYAGRVHDLQRAKFAATDRVDAGGKPVLDKKTGKPLLDRITVDGEFTARHPFDFKLDQQNLKLDADFQDLPKHVLTTIDVTNGKVAYDGFGEAMNRAHVNARQTEPLFVTSPPFSVGVTRADVTATGLPAKLDLGYSTADGRSAGFTASEKVGTVEALLTSDQAISLPPGESGFRVEDMPDRFVSFARARGVRELKFRKLNADGKSEASAELDRQPLHGMYKTVVPGAGEIDVDAKLSDIPSEIVSLTSDPKAGTVEYRATDGIDTLDATITSQNPLFGRVKRIVGRVENIPAALDLGFKPTSGSGGAFNACPEPSPGQPVLVRCDGVDLIEVELTDGAKLADGTYAPADRFTDKRSGVMFRDLSSRFSVFARLKEVTGGSVTSTGSGGIDASVSTGELSDGSRQSFDVDASFEKFGDAISVPATLKGTISTLPAKVTINQRDSETEYTAEGEGARVPRVTLRGSNLPGDDVDGAVHEVDATLEGVPSKFKVRTAAGETGIDATAANDKFDRIDLALWDRQTKPEWIFPEGHNGAMLDTRSERLAAKFRVFDLKKALFSEPNGGPQIDTVFASAPAPLDVFVLDDTRNPDERVPSRYNTQIGVNAKELPTEVKIGFPSQLEIAGKPSSGTIIDYTANNSTTDVHADIRLADVTALVDVTDIPSRAKVCVGTSECGAQATPTFMIDDDDVGELDKPAVMFNDFALATEANAPIRLKAKVCLPPTTEEGNRVPRSAAPWDCAPHDKNFIDIDNLRLQTARLEFASGDTDNKDGSDFVDDGLLKLWVDTDATGIKLDRLKLVNTFTDSVTEILKGTDPPLRNMNVGSPFFMVFDLDTEAGPIDPPDMEQWNNQQIDCRNLTVWLRLPFRVPIDAIEVLEKWQSLPGTSEPCFFG